MFTFWRLDGLKTIIHHPAAVTLHTESGCCGFDNACSPTCHAAAAGRDVLQCQCASHTDDKDEPPLRGGAVKPGESGAAKAFKEVEWSTLKSILPETGMAMNLEHFKVT